MAVDVQAPTWAHVYHGKIIPLGDMDIGFRSPTTPTEAGAVVRLQMANPKNRSKLALEEDLLASHVDIEDQTYGDEVRHEGAAAVAQERKGDTCHRHKAHCHTDINHDMDKNHRRDSCGDQLTEGVLGS